MLKNKQKFYVFFSLLACIGTNSILSTPHAWLVLKEIPNVYYGERITLKANDAQLKLPRVLVENNEVLTGKISEGTITLTHPEEKEEKGDVYTQQELACVYHLLKASQSLKNESKTREELLEELSTATLPDSHVIRKIIKELNFRNLGFAYLYLTITGNCKNKAELCQEEVFKHGLEEFNVAEEFAQDCFPSGFECSKCNGPIFHKYCVYTCKNNEGTQSYVHDSCDDQQCPSCQASDCARTSVNTMHDWIRAVLYDQEIDFIYGISPNFLVTDEKIEWFSPEEKREKKYLTAAKAYNTIISIKNNQTFLPPCHLQTSDYVALDSPLFSPDGKKVLALASPREESFGLTRRYVKTGLRNAYVWILQNARGRNIQEAYRLQVFTDSSEGPPLVNFNPSSTLIIAKSDKKHITLYNAETGKGIKEIPSAEFVWRLGFSQCGNYFIPEKGQHSGIVITPPNLKIEQLLYLFMLKAAAQKYEKDLNTSKLFTDIHASLSEHSGLIDIVVQKFYQPLLRLLDNNQE